MVNFKTLAQNKHQSSANVANVANVVNSPICHAHARARKYIGAENVNNVDNVNKKPDFLSDSMSNSEIRDNSEPFATCPVCKQRFWLEPRDNGCHEFQCPTCFDEGLAVPLIVDGFLLQTWENLPFPDEYVMADFHERAAIRQYDGCMTRAEAERLALYDIGIFNDE